MNFDEGIKYNDRTGAQLDRITVLKFSFIFILHSSCHDPVKDTVAARVPIPSIGVVLVETKHARRR